jgi:hypothetical protein
MNRQRINRKRSLVLTCRRCGKEVRTSNPLRKWCAVCHELEKHRRQVERQRRLNALRAAGLAPPPKPVELDPKLLESYQPAEPKDPSLDPPGTLSRIETYALRYQRGEALFCELDGGGVESRGSRAGK